MELKTTTTHLNAHAEEDQDEDEDENQMLAGGGVNDVLQTYDKV